MPRRPRIATGGHAFHVLNRAVGRGVIFEKDADYLAFEKVLSQVHARLPVPTRLDELGESPTDRGGGKCAGRVHQARPTLRQRPLDRPCGQGIGADVNPSPSWKTEKAGSPMKRLPTPFLSPHECGYL